MALEIDLQAMTRHLVDVLDRKRLEIIESGESAPAFEVVGYGEPRVITRWPYLSVQPQQKTRELKGTRKFDIKFNIWVILYHGIVADTLQIQEETHRRAEAVETFLNSDHKWNFVDSADPTKNKVIFGLVSFIDHPIVVAPEDELWSSSRLELVAETEEVF